MMSLPTHQLHRILARSLAQIDLRSLATLDRTRAAFATLVAFVPLLSAAPSRAVDYTLAEPLPFSELGATGAILPVSGDEILAGPTCTSGDCFSLGPMLYYRFELDAGSGGLIAVIAAFPGLGLASPDGGSVGYVADDDPATRRPSGVTSAITAPFERGPSFAFVGAVGAAERTEVLFRAYPAATPAPPDDLASFRLWAQLGGPFASLGSVAIQPVPEPDGAALASVAVGSLGVRAWQRRGRYRMETGPR
jgi:hypothetical protein